MPSQGQEIKSPIKGVHKNAAFADHDPAYALDALNVLPYDLYGRLRVSQRPGTSKLTATTTALGLPSPVRMLAQTTVPLDPTTANLIVLDNFNRSDRAIDGDAINSNYLWIQPINAKWAISSNTLTASATQAAGEPGNTAFPVEVSAAVPVVQVATSGASYILKAKVHVTGTGSTLTDGVGFVVRGAITSVGLVTVAPAITAFINRHHAGLYFNNVTTQKATHTFSSLLASGGTHDLELRVDDTTYKLYVDGVLRCSATIADTYDPNLASPLVGVWSRNATAGDYVEDFAVYSREKSYYRRTNIIAVSGGNVYVGNATTLPVATSGTSVVASAVRPQFAYTTGYGYIVDGVNIVKLDIAATSVVAYTASAGSAPTGCTLAAVYRDRLCLAAPQTTPHLFFFSRVGSHTDWDYSQTDPAAAFAGNASVAGRIGDPIVALMPASDDYMYIGGDHNLWIIRGDPADGGSIDMVSDAVGVLGPNAWTKAPDGTIYMLGTGGLFKLSGDSPPELLSDAKWSDFFRQIDRAANHLTLTWDRDKHGLFVFITPISGAAGTHLWFDARNMGFWPVKFPANYGPYAALVFDGDAASDRVTMMGTGDGYIMRLYDTDGSDDGTAISSYVYVGPFKADDLADQTLESLDVILGEPATFHTNSDWSVNVQVRAGPTAEVAFNSPLRTVDRTYTTTSRRQSRWRQRLRGNAFVVKLSNSTTNRTWSFERAVGVFMPSGPVRRYK